jgi:hypothetical protein
VKAEASVADRWHVQHSAERDRMLAAAVEMLAADERFVAAWLSGSFGRGDDDALSDIDITVVVAGDLVDQLCRRDHQVGAGTTPERLAVLRSVGEPAIIHENHFNAPSGGSFTACVYASGIVFDWVIIPVANAVRPAETRLLFDTVGIPDQVPGPTLTDLERAQRLAEQVAFFWMMIVPTSKARLRGDSIDFHEMLDMLYRVADGVERLLKDEPPRYLRGSRAPFARTTVEQQDAVKAVCERMDNLAPAIVDAGATVPETRWDAVRVWVEATLPSSS